MQSRDRKLTIRIEDDSIAWLSFFILLLAGALIALFIWAPWIG